MTRNDTVNKVESHHIAAATELPQLLSLNANWQLHKDAVRLCALCSEMKKINVGNGKSRGEGVRPPVFRSWRRQWVVLIYGATKREYLASGFKIR